MMFCWRTIRQEISGKHYWLAFFFPKKINHTLCFINSLNNLNRAAVDESQSWKSQPDNTNNGILWKGFWLYPAATTSESPQKRGVAKLECISEYFKSQQQATVWWTLNSSTVTQNGENRVTNLITITSIFPAPQALASRSPCFNNFSFLYLLFSGGSIWKQNQKPNKHQKDKKKKKKTL